MSLYPEKTPAELQQYLFDVTDGAWEPEQFLQEPLERAGMHVWGVENQPTFQALDVPQLSLAVGAVAATYLLGKKTQYQVITARNIGHLAENFKGHSDEEIAKQAGVLRTTVATRRSEVFKGCRAVKMPFEQIIAAVGGSVLPPDPEATFQRTGKREAPARKLTAAGRVILDEVLEGKIGDGWAGWAACQDVPNFDKASMPPELEKAKAICAHCRALKDCLSEAIINGDVGAVRGGMTQPEREDYTSRLNRIGARRASQAS